MYDACVAIFAVAHATSWYLYCPNALAEIDVRRPAAQSPAAAVLGVPGGLRHPAGAGADTRPARAGHVVHRRVRAAPPRARSVFRAADVAGRVRGRALRAHVVVPARAPGLGGSVLAASLVPGRAIRDGRGRRHLGAAGARARASVTPPAENGSTAWCGFETHMVCCYMRKGRKLPVILCSTAARGAMLNEALGPN